MQNNKGHWVTKIWSSAYNSPQKLLEKSLKIDMKKRIPKDRYTQLKNDLWFMVFGDAEKQNVDQTV